MMRTLIFSSLLVLGLTACPATQPTTPAPAISASGTWEGRESFPAQNGFNADSSNVRYVLSDNAGTLSGQLFFCGSTTFTCDTNASSVSGSRNGSAVTLRYTASLGDPNDPNNTATTQVVTQATLSGASLTGTTTYPSGDRTFSGSTTLTKK